MGDKDREVKLQEGSHALHHLSFRPWSGKTAIHWVACCNDSEYSLWGKSLASNLGSAAHQMYDPYANHLDQLSHPLSRANSSYPNDKVSARTL